MAISQTEEKLFKTIDQCLSLVDREIFDISFSINTNKVNITLKTTVLNANKLSLWNSVWMNDYSLRLSKISDYGLPKEITKEFLIVENKESKELCPLANPLLFTQLFSQWYHLLLQELLKTVNALKQGSDYLKNTLLYSPPLNSNVNSYDGKKSIADMMSELDKARTRELREKTDKVEKVYKETNDILNKLIDKLNQAINLV